MGTQEIDGFLLDIGGVLYQGDALIPGAAAALTKLREAGTPFRLITNTTRQSKQLLIGKLSALGLEVAPDEVLTTAILAEQRLKELGAKPYLLVHPALEEDLPPPADDPDTVLIGDAGEHFTYPALNGAFRVLMNGGRLIALGRNAYFMGDSGLELDAGPFVAALEYAAGVEAELLGKPSPAFFLAAAEAAGLSPGRTLMVGDQVASDVQGAMDAGFQGALVQTGAYRAGDEARAPGCHLYPSIAELVEDCIAR